MPLLVGTLRRHLIRFNGNLLTWLFSLMANVEALISTGQASADLAEPNTTGQPTQQASDSIEQIRMEFSQYGSGAFELYNDAESAIALLCIKNCNKKNCFTGSMMAQFTDVLDEVERWNEVSQE